MLSNIGSSVIGECKSEAIVGFPLPMDLLDQIRDDRYKWDDAENVDWTGFAFGSSSKPSSPSSLRSSGNDPSL